MATANEREREVSALITEAFIARDAQTLMHLCHALNVHFGGVAIATENGYADQIGQNASEAYRHALDYIHAHVLPQAEKAGAA